MSNHFFIIGAQRSGTTLLLENLIDHSSIEMAAPVRPEPKYFLREQYEISLKEYKRLYFNSFAESVWLGEKSTTYIERPDSAKKILSQIPAAKFIVILRDPVERAISNYWFSVKNGLELRSPEQALSVYESEKKYSGDFSTSPYRYLQRGLYLPMLDRYCSQLTHRESLLVLQLESLISKPLATLNRVCHFLALDPFLEYKEKGSVNSALRAGTLDESVLSSLYEFYAAHNRKLSDYYDIDCSLWEAN